MAFYATLARSVTPLADLAPVPTARFGLRLATQITLPFVALFSLLLSLLGWVVAREILEDVRARVEQQQRFVLAVVAYYPTPPYEAFLRELRDRAVGPDETGDGLEIVVQVDPEPPVTTLDLSRPEHTQLLSDLRSAVREPKYFPGLSDPATTSRLHTTQVPLAGQVYLIHYASRLMPLEPSRTVRPGYFVLYPLARVEEAQNRALARIAGLGALGVALAALLGWVMARWITRPVRRLAVTAGRLASGGLSESLDSGRERGPAEIAELAAAFQTMVESLRRSQEELLKSERLASTGRLAASVAHEIRNPLTSMRITVQVLADRQPQADEATRKAYAIVLSEIDRLELAVEELLTFARPRPAQRAPTDLNKLCAETLDFLRRQLEHAKVAAKLEADPALPSDLPLDANKIRQLLVNLVLNAMQAIVRNGTVTVRTRWDAHARRVSLEVADTGPGIPEQVRERVFEVFVSTKPGGGGLGLAIAKQIAEEHAGSIRFETGKSGTVFFVALPVGEHDSPA